MKIDGTEFGSITISGKTYDHDVVIRLSEQVVKRKKKLSKRIYGSSHTVSEDEVRFVFEKGCKQLIFGTGQYRNAALSPEAAGVDIETSAPPGRPHTISGPTTATVRPPITISARSPRRRERRRV